ncbi:hypothetical protein ACFPRL_13490 [Pseudoclavibacter helvolus]
MFRHGHGACTIDGYLRLKGVDDVSVQRPLQSRVEAVVVSGAHEGARARQCPQQPFVPDAGESRPLRALQPHTIGAEDAQ